MKMQRTIETTMNWRGLALMAAAGCLLLTGAPAQACSGPLQPNYMAGKAAEMARMMIPAAASTPATLAARGNPEAQQSHAPSIVGLWQTSYLQNNVVVDQGFEVWHSDGTEILVDIAPPATDNVCIGTWAQVGTLTYTLTHPSWTFDMNGNLTGTAMILNSVTISHDGNSFTGSFTINTYDVNGVPNGHLAGQLSGKRIQPQ